LKNNRLKYSTVGLFLFLSLFVKLAGLHMLHHSDDKDQEPHCKVCLLAISHNVTPGLSPNLQYFSIENTTVPVVKEEGTHYCFIICRGTFASLPFSRPPPTLI